MDVDDLKQELRNVYDDVRQQRDELRVRLHLASAEAKEVWEELEQKWDNFEARSEQMFDEAKDAGGDIAEAAQLLGSEIKQGYKRLRRLL
ncbi:MAG: hypothetical protein OEW35_09805 [Gammaproteobacteria bacterium]|nr:hypothetical protein [Gammaproteobacteria bacterium]MDH4253659.1 hypothetical protein [Gammaproteobacteria bacterium]MDH5309775.1 hypothetical protein [Gammaproteobacteria bacterium]